jgi:hypothetical protein
MMYEVCKDTHAPSPPLGGGARRAGEDETMNNVRANNYSPQQRTTNNEQFNRGVPEGRDSHNHRRCEAPPADNRPSAAPLSFRRGVGGEDKGGQSPSTPAVPAPPPAGDTRRRPGTPSPPLGGGARRAGEDEGWGWPQAGGGRNNEQ